MNPLSGFYNTCFNTWSIASSTIRVLQFLKADKVSKKVFGGPEFEFLRKKSKNISFFIAMKLKTKDELKPTYRFSH